MAGRGTDIKLGGNKDFDDKEKLNDQMYFKENETKVKNLGGLFIIGTERHESRRIDNRFAGVQVDKVILARQYFLSVYKMS